MQPIFNIENLISYLKSKKKIIISFSLIMAVLYSSFRIFTKLNKYETEIKFYVTNSESVDYESILDKGFIDLSVGNRDLLRLQSFGYSNQLIQLVIDSTNLSEFEFLRPLKERGNLIGYISNLYQINISDLGELEVLVIHENELFSYFLCHQIMEGINSLNNSFLSEFKNDQIEVSKRQLILLNNEKKTVLEKINKLSKKVNQSELEAIRQFGKNELVKVEIKEYLLNIKNPDKFELNLAFDKVRNLDKSIENFNRTLYSDRWSLEMLKKKKPFITQNKPAKRKRSIVNIVFLFLSSFSIFFFIITLFYSLNFRYQKYIKLLVS